jgi:hypothetical protein
MDFWWTAFSLFSIGLIARYAWKAVARKQAGEISPLLNYRKGAFRAKVVSLGTPSLPGSVKAATSPVLPPENLSRANANSRTGLSAPLEEQSTNRAFWGAAVVDTAIAPGVDIWMRWASVDSHVFQAVEHLSHEQIEGVADLLTVVDAKSYAIESAGFFNKLLGHVGEWHALEHLQQAEIPVSMPLGSNQEGWDIQAGEVGINVKTVQDAASAASSHFAKYPDLPIIVPGDAAHIPSDALYFDPSKGMSLDAIGSHHHQVIVDTALSHADVAEQTHNAIDVVSDPGVHAHFPWVTAAVSGFREAKLLAKGHTDLARASKNVGVDVVAVGGAGAIGGKVGAVIGTTMGPIGTVVGGVIGAAIGGAMGRGAANQIKQKPLREARQQYETAFAACQSKQDELESYAQQRWTQEKVTESQHLHVISRDALQSLKPGLEKEKLELRSSVLFGREEAMTYLRMALEHMSSVVEKERAELAFGKWRKLPWLRLPGKYLELQQHEKEMASRRQEIGSLLKAWQGSPQNVADCLDLVLAAPGGEKAVSDYLQRIDQKRAKAIVAAGRLHQVALDRVAEEREWAVKRLKGYWAQLIADVEAKFSPFVEDVKSKAEVLKAELRKAGVVVA